MDPIADAVQIASGLKLLKNVSGICGIKILVNALEFPKAGLFLDNFIGDYQAGKYRFGMSENYFVLDASVAMKRSYKVPIKRNQEKEIQRIMEESLSYPELSTIVVQAIDAKSGLPAIIILSLPDALSVYQRIGSYIRSLSEIEADSSYLN